jgi:hypothetical protein
MGKNTRAPKAVNVDVATKGTVVIGVASRGTCESHLARTLGDLMLWDSRYGRQHLDPERPIIWTIGATQVVNARNTLVHQFLASDQGEWLLMIDDDQVYPKELLEYLIESVDKDERPIVGVPVWRMQSETNDPDQVKVTHNVLDMHESNAFVEYEDNLPPNSVIQVPAIGTGCMIVHRSVFERMADWCEGKGMGRRWCWFRHNVYMPADMAEGEDLYFCRLAGMMGIPVYASTFTTLGHVKSIILNGALPAGTLKV